MAGVLRSAAGRLSVAAVRVTTVSRPSAFPTGPRASLVPRLIHTEVVPSPRFPSWVREEIRLMVKEAIDAELKEVRAACWERYESLSAKHIEQGELAATRHGEVMVKLVQTQERMAQIAFRVCVGMVGLAAAAQYQGEIAKMLMKIVDGGTAGDPQAPTTIQQQEVATIIQQEVKAATIIIGKELSETVKREIANHFEQQNKD